MLSEKVGVEIYSTFFHRESVGSGNVAEGRACPRLSQVDRWNESSYGVNVAQQNCPRTVLRVDSHDIFCLLGALCCSSNTSRYLDMSVHRAPFA